MRHPSSRELFEYWNKRRGWRPAPERGEIDPVAIRGVLADTFLLAHQPCGGPAFRIAGTRVCALFGRELKNHAFLDLWSAGCRRQIGDLIAVVAEEAIGVVAGATGTDLDATLRLELLLLPLAVGGRTDARLIGTLAAREPPAWLGMHVLTGLSLGTYRYLANPPAPPLCAGGHGPWARVRHGLVVHDGGRT